MGTGTGRGIWEMNIGIVAVSLLLVVVMVVNVVGVVVVVVLGSLDAVVAMFGSAIFSRREKGVV